jgi:hypothetical protein
MGLSDYGVVDIMDFVFSRHYDLNSRTDILTAEY